MSEPVQLESIRPDQVFDGGDLDCGSGLLLLIRRSMLKVPEGGILEMRSCEPTVVDDLPPCRRMVGYDYLGKVETPRYIHYFIRRGTGAKADKKALAQNKARAKTYEWRQRILT